MLQFVRGASWIWLDYICSLKEHHLEEGIHIYNRQHGGGRLAIASPSNKRSKKKALVLTEDKEVNMGEWLRNHPQTCEGI